ncbi:MAG: redoxin domain-containing protein [Bacteroidetes bacterium]|nr:redoxin domain-containing protein [Bacteroidota bacterium]
MKRIFLFFLLLSGASVFAQSGYEIKVTFKPFKNQYIYLGHYFGKTYPIIDSVLLNNKSEGVFKGPKKLNGGIYLIGYPGRNGFFEILVDKQQHFSVMADTATIKDGAKFINSQDNVAFTAYQQYTNKLGREIAALQKKLKTAANKKDSTVIENKITANDKAINAYREAIIKKKDGSLLYTLLNAMQEPVLTGRLKNPQNKKDSIDSYNFYKANYWKGVNFWDSRLAYTPFFEDKIEKYFNQLVPLNPDSVIKEMDYMLGYASVNEEMNRFMLLHFVNKYLSQRFMWEDAVFVHLFEKYFANKQYTWLNDKGRKIITDRAYSLMANITGTPAADIELPNTKGDTTSLYKTVAAHTVVVFWDPTCGHCKETLPKIDSIYQAKWKAEGVKIFAVAKETDGTKNDWFNFIKDHHLEDWINVYYSKAAEKARTDNNIPGYSQLYDVLSFPTLYLLDLDKKIVAKKLSYDQLDEILDLKTKGQ